jgi:exosortase A-associated hydrolase 2
MSPALDMFFHPASDGGQRLYLHHHPAADTPKRGALVYVHPWAEEMNKSRRMAALTARALATDGWAVLQLDLHGCGDSGGDFADASWDSWVEDTVVAVQWMRQRHPGLPIWLWGLRAGALLCAAAARRVQTDAHLLLWQPVHQGRQVLQQFLRLKAAAQLAQGGGKAILDALRAELLAGRHVSIAGYALGPALAKGLEAAVLAPPGVADGVIGAPVRQLVWIEVTSQQEPALSPMAQTSLPRWREAGWHTTAAAISGAPFWQTTEIETAPALIAATREALLAGPVARSREVAPA